MSNFETFVKLCEKHFAALPAPRFPTRAEHDARMNEAKRRALAELSEGAAS